MNTPVSRAAQINLQAIRELQQLVAQEELIQVESETVQSDTSPMAIYQRFLPMQELKSSKKAEEKQEQALAGQEKIKGVGDAEEAASRFQSNNNELKSKTLLILRSTLTLDDTPEEILNKVLKVYPDHALADEALDYLIETADGPMKNNLILAKEHLNRSFAREVAAGRNIGEQSRAFEKQGLAGAASLRDMYRDITGNPREPLKLFEELTDKFQYEKLKTAITFLLHALGADLKSKGPSIPPGELVRLIGETRSLQGILGIFGFFQSRLRLMQRQFNTYDLLYPPRLTFEVLAKTFIKLLAERYVNPDKIKQFAKLLGISEEVAAQIVIFTQYRDAMKQIAPRYYRNQVHREELQKALLDTLEELEDEFEEEEENDQPNQKKNKEDS